MITSKEQHLKQTNRLRGVLVVVISLLFGGLMAALLYYPVPEENRSTLFIMVGSLNALFGAIVTYYFGTSAGSNKKEDKEEKKVE